MTRVVTKVYCLKLKNFLITRAFQMMKEVPKVSYFRLTICSENSDFQKTRAAI